MKKAIPLIIAVVIVVAAIFYFESLKPGEIAQEPAVSLTDVSIQDVSGQLGQEVSQRVLEKHQQYASAKDFVNPDGFINTEEFSLADEVGKKVILVDFLTYSCINCQRTFPYLNAWYEKYKDQGLEIIGIHTPEFAFERDINNVKDAMKRFGITHPIVLDNDYATWRAYGNRFWPRKYLIDIMGKITYDHIGEGAYEETEMKIQELLRERAKVLGMNATEIDKNLAITSLPRGENFSESPETYFGALRNKYLANGTTGLSGEQTFTLPLIFTKSRLYLGGTWNIDVEYAESVSDAVVFYKYNAKEVYLVADADSLVEVEVWQDGKPVGIEAGADVGVEGNIMMKESRLYKIINNIEPGEHTLELRVKDKGLHLYAFTFG